MTSVAGVKPLARASNAALRVYFRRYDDGWYLRLAEDDLDAWHRGGQHLVDAITVAHQERMERTASTGVPA